MGHFPTRNFIADFTNHLTHALIIKGEQHLNYLAYMYVIVWEYKVKPENWEKFEKAYGPEGSWANFFRKSEHYRGTCLFKSEKASDAYLLLDFWNTKEAYDHFKSTQADTYQQLSHQLQDVYQEEAKVDAYHAIH